MTAAPPLDEAAQLVRLRLARTEGVGPANWNRMLARFGTPEAAVAGFAEFAGRAGLKAALADPGAVRREWESVRSLGGSFLFLGGPDYPPLLALLPQSPPVIAVLGDASILSTRSVAVVGARNASANGQRIAEEIAEALARAGITVVSGLARGIDAAAHAGALRGGRTVGVLPGGLDTCYPPENAELQDRIGREGVLVAESPFGTAPLSRHFPRRNRIVAGLSLGVVVVEAALGSGTLITANMAIEHDREVYAVPGSPLDPRSKGSNDLLRQGATFCEGADDVLATLPEAPRLALTFRAPKRRPEAAPNAAAAPASGGDPGGDAGSDVSQVLELIGAAPVPVDEVLRRCHLSPSAAQAILLDLELAGRVELLPGNRIVRCAVPGANTVSGSA